MKEEHYKKVFRNMDNDPFSIQPFYNPKACELIEKYGERHEYNFQHAENGGEQFVEELGYWVDGYDEEENVVIEVYENHHYKNGKLREDDKRREEEIKNYLKCKFIRIKFEDCKQFFE